MFSIEFQQTIDPTITGNENLRLNKDLSPELLALADTNLDLLNIRHNDLCTHFPINLAGALVAQNLIQEINAHFLSINRKEIIPHDRIIKILPSVEIFNTVDGESWDIPVRKSGTVLFKGVCGRRAGIVLDGPYSGLLVRGFADDTETTETDLINMRAVRILDDVFFSADVTPYQVILNGLGFTTEQHLLVQKTMAYRYTELALKSYGLNTSSMSATQMYEASQKLSNDDISHIDMIQYQCAHMGIPFDKNVLHYYTPKIN